MSHTQPPTDSIEVNGIQSMTGFGQAQVSSKLCRLSLQLKSVNSRFLDLTLKIPDELAAFEGKLREAITHTVKRGKVEARLSWQTILPTDNEGAGDSNVALINAAALAQALAVQNAILAHAPSASPLSVSALMNAPAVLPSSVGASEVLAAVTADEINGLINSAIAQFKQSRQQEGTHLAQAIFERLNAIAVVVQNLRVQLPELLKHQEAKLTERLLKALDSGKNEVTLATSAIPREELIERIRQEASLTAIRIDVAEELDRLDGHLGNARQCFVEGGNVGKKLDFLMQEFNREANTLGSKSASLLQTQASLDLKLMIEQMREQVQNLE